MPILLPDMHDFSLPIDTDITVKGTSKSVGKIKGASGRYGIALLRLKQAADAVHGKTTLSAKGYPVDIQPVVPPWWPWKDMLNQINFTDDVDVKM